MVPEDVIRPVPCCGSKLASESASVCALPAPCAAEEEDEEEDEVISPSRFFLIPLDEDDL